MTIPLTHKSWKAMRKASKRGTAPYPFNTWRTCKPEHKAGLKRLWKRRVKPGGSKGVEYWLEGMAGKTTN